MIIFENESTPFYENRGLFSDHFLVERLPGLPEWRETEIEGAIEEAREIYEANRDVLENLNEAETEEEFIRPVLDRVLGWSYGVQKAQRYQGRLRRPDYGLFLDEATKREALAQEASRDYWARTAGVADAKYWARPLDGKGDPVRERFPELSSTNPSMQIVSYLIATGCEWGVLTNGSHWRLYSTRARSRIDTYYEVDLERILLEGDEEAFRRFYLLFRAEAFQVDAGTGKTFLERLHEGSVRYGTVLESQLKTLIFDEIFLHLADGFRAHEFAADAEVSQEDLDTIYQGTLRLLYRLLFLLHAEARALLPVHDERGYGQYSLAHLTGGLAERRDEGARFSGVRADLWSELEGLFAIVDQGDADLNVPRYNGGLFEREHPANAFLDSSRIADRYLAPGLDKLVRVEDADTGQRRFVDYKTLNVEQLGSIYEGLLEFRLRQANEDLAVLRDGRDVEYKPADEVEDPDEVIEAGDLYLESDEGERKTTGSYYTPHEVVTYIVEQTLTPVLEERADRFRSLMEELEEGDGNEEELKAEAIELVLGIRVCDPAMGSGHFLVQATDWLTEHLIPLLNEFPDNPVLERLGEIRERILEEMSEQEVDIDQDRLKDVNLLKRAIMKRCIYGVDLNPMAVELAKLSLWLDSFTVGAPLSFLDHHLLVGNSVAGASVETVRTQLTESEAQGALFGQQFAGLLEATELVKEVASYTDATLEEVEESAAKYGEFRQAIEPYRWLLDLWVSQHFGLEAAAETVRDYGTLVLDMFREGEKFNPELQKRLVAARALWNRHQYLHWELEFPEVFVDLDEQTWRENPGFDVVMGNPPYLNAWRMTDEAPELRDGIKGVFAETDLLSGHWDLFVPFILRAIEVTRRNGQHSFIVPNPVLLEKYTTELRCRRLLVEDFIESVLDFGEIRVFPDVSRQTVVYTVAVGGGERIKAGDETSIRVLRGGEGGQQLDELDEFRWDESHSLSPEHWRETYNCQIRTSPDFFEAIPLLQYIADRSEPLGRFRYVNVGATVSSEEAGAFSKSDVVSDTPLGNAKKFFAGRNISRYDIDWRGQWLDYREEEMSGARSPEMFEADKVLVRKRTIENERLVAAFDSSGMFCDDTVIVLCGFEPLEDTNARTELEDYPRGDQELSDYFLLALLNSELLSFYFRFRFATGALQGSYSDVWPETVRAFPLRRVERDADDVETRAAWVEATVKAAVEEGRLDDVLAAVEDRHDGSDRTAGDLHDLLAELARRLEAMQAEKRRLYDALNPFKWLNAGAEVAPFAEVFGEEIKYGELIADGVDLGVVHHDISALRLRSDSDRWLLEVELEKRDPVTGWRQKLKEDDGREIAREWVPALRFEMDEERARYYEQILQVRDEFEDAGAFPGGFTRTTLEKLQQTTVPRFEPAADLEPLVELRSEIEALEIRADRLDQLIDEVVYRLYDLQASDQAFVERVMA